MNKIMIKLLGMATLRVCIASVFVIGGYMLTRWAMSMDVPGEERGDVALLRLLMGLAIFCIGAGLSVRALWISVHGAVAYSRSGAR